MKSKKIAPTQLEVEVKVRVHNLKALTESLEKLGCKEVMKRTFEQNWIWDFPNSSLRTQGQLLRVREVAGRCSLTFKAPAGTSRQFKVREELETDVSDCKTLMEILGRIGMVVTFRYQKFRASYSMLVPGRNRTVSLTLDTTPIGNYLEIEGSARDIKLVASKLGYRQRDFIKESYMALFEKSDLRKRQTFMVFADLDQAENPLTV
jgi:adenylate cyclase class 2